MLIFYNSNWNLIQDNYGEPKDRFKAPRESTLGAQKAQIGPKQSKNLTFLLIKMVQFQGFDEFFVQLLSPDMEKLLGNKT